MEQSVSISIYQKKKVIFTFFLLFAFSSSIYCQEHRLTIQPTFGMSLRAGIMHVFNFKPIDPEDWTSLYPSERNVQGLSLNPGLLISKNNVLSFEYFPNLRHDDIHRIKGKENVYVKQFIVDHNFNLSIKKSLTYGIGYSIINAGKSYHFVNPVPRVQNIQFTTVNAFVQTPIFKKRIDNLHLEFKALLMPHGYPYDSKHDYVMYSLRVFYQFRPVSEWKRRNKNN